MNKIELPGGSDSQAQLKTAEYQTIGHQLHERISKLMSLRDFLLPLLMNGQVKVGWSHGAG